MSLYSIKMLVPWHILVHNKRKNIKEFHTHRISGSFSPLSNSQWMYSLCPVLHPCADLYSPQNYPALSSNHKAHSLKLSHYPSCADIRHMGEILRHHSQPWAKEQIQVLLLWVLCCVRHQRQKTQYEILRRWECPGGITDNSRVASGCRSMFQRPSPRPSTGTHIQLDCRSARRTQNINLLTN